MPLSKITILVAIMAILTGSYLLLKTENSSINFIDQNQKFLYKEAVTHWETKIPKLNIEKLQDEFVSIGNALGAGKAHLLAHSFGEALFNIKGIEGIKSCTDNFIYGCYHQIIGTATAEIGINAIDQILTLCKDSDADIFACGHAVGHGNLGYFGYTFEGLTEALEVCNNSSNVNEGTDRERRVLSFGCIDGTFMEYNLRRLADNERREFTPDTPFEPCDSVDISFRLNCIFELPNWWITTINPKLSKEGKFDLLGSYCSLLQDIDDSRTCFQRTGYLTSSYSDLVLEDSAGFCEIAKRSTEDYLFCITGAVRRFNNETEKTFIAKDLCQKFGLRDEWLNYCVEYGSNDRDQLRSLDALKSEYNY